MCGASGAKWRKVAVPSLLTATTLAGRPAATVPANAPTEQGSTSVARGPALRSRDALARNPDASLGWVVRSLTAGRLIGGVCDQPGEQP